MHYTIKYLVLVLGVIHSYMMAAQKISGTIVDQQGAPLQGVWVHWLGETEGNYTSENGNFELLRRPHNDQLVVSYLGRPIDTMFIPHTQTSLSLKLRPLISTQEIEVVGQKPSHNFSLQNPINIETLERKEFKKAACCSLAESFTTSNAVDLSYANAVAGNREIQFLGLRGLYTQQLIENRPAFQGISSALGYDLIPGTWLDEINIQKGASTSIYGGQSMAGSINVVLKKPEADHRFFANAFADGHGRSEVNFHINRSWSQEDHSGLYLHAAHHLGRRDHNRDGFADDPRLKRFNALWRNTLYGSTWEGQLNAQAFYDRRDGGQIRKENPYMIDQLAKGVNLFGNLGFVGFEQANRTLGSTYDIHVSQIQGKYGFKRLDAEETRWFMQLFYEEKWMNERQRLISSFSGLLAKAHEHLTVGANADLVQYREALMGWLAEYTFKNKCDGAHQISLGVSQRLDFLQVLGLGNKILYLPRFNMRYGPNDLWTIRLSAGRGYRHPRAFSNQLNLLADNKTWKIHSAPRIEISWNAGGNIIGKPFLAGKELTINLDIYHTWFDQQMIVDLDFSDREVNIYALNGSSSAFQALLTLAYPILPVLQFKAGTKYTKTTSDLLLGRRDQVFIPQWRGLASLDYESRNKKWLINFTANFTGAMPLPIKTTYPIHLVHNHGGRSKPYMLMQTQINYMLKKWEWYIGAENIGDFVQHNAIIDAENPFGPYFTATEVYAPVAGFKPFIGLRYKWN